MLYPALAASSLYIALWVALAVVFVASLIVIRTQWARQRPLHRCMLWSLVAHLVLVAIAATIRLVSWTPGNGPEEPLRVTIVAAAPQHPRPNPETPATEQPEEPNEPAEPQPAEPEAPSDEPEPPAEDASPLVAPELMAAASPAEAADNNQPEPEPDDTADTEPPPADSSTNADASAANQAAATDEQQQPDTSSTVDAPPAAANDRATEEKHDSTPAEATPAPATPPAALAERARPDRLQRVVEQGGSRETEQAVARALEWLAQAQSSDGRWDCDHWQGGRELMVLGHNRRGAGSRADTGVTGLALLTFLGAGHTHLEGGYRHEVARGLVYLMRSQAADGCLAGDATFYARTYCHSMATFAVAEAYALTGDERLHPTVQRAVEYLLQAENKSYGGWRYQPGDLGDVSQLGWVIMALRSAELADLDVPEETWQRIEQFLARVARGRHGGLAAYQPRTAASRAMTAEALYCRQVLGKPPSDAALGEALGDLAGELPGMGLTNYYYWYYATLALHHAQRQGSEAADVWHRWNNRLKRQLVAAQVADGTNAGSWSPNTIWGGYGGRVYSTALAAMCLEVYYRYGSGTEDQSPWVASRPRGEVK